MKLKQTSDLFTIVNLSMIQNICQSRANEGEARRSGKGVVAKKIAMALGTDTYRVQ
jgi:hypothetical protein